MARDRIGDADAADQKRGQADQRQELGEAFDVAFELRRRLVAGADFPAGVRKFAISPGSRPPPPRCRSHWPPGSRSRYCQRTRLPGCRSPVARSAASLMSTRGPRPMPPASLSGSAVSAARSSIVAAADGDRGRRFSDRAGSAAPDRRRRRTHRRLRKNRRQRHRRIGRNAAEQRIIGVDRFDLDQRRSLPVARCAPWRARWRRPRPCRARPGKRARRARLHAE